VADIHALRSIKEQVSDQIAKDLRAAVDDAIAAGATGFYLVFENAEQLEMRARIMAPRVHQFIGFTESTLKPALIRILNG
jgi:hypothetical protein